MRRNLGHARRDDEAALLNPAEGPFAHGGRRQVSFGRIPSHSSLDPNEDPASGLDRVSSASNLQGVQRRLERERRLRLQREALRPERPSQPNPHLHSLSDAYECLDYEVVENELYRAEETTKDHQVGAVTGFIWV